MLLKNSPIGVSEQFPCLLLWLCRPLTVKIHSKRNLQVRQPSFRACTGSSPMRRAAFPTKYYLYSLVVRYYGSSTNRSLINNAQPQKNAAQHSGKQLWQDTWLNHSGIWWLSLLASFIFLSISGMVFMNSFLSYPGSWCVLSHRALSGLYTLNGSMDAYLRNALLCTLTYPLDLNQQHQQFFLPATSKWQQQEVLFHKAIIRYFNEGGKRTKQNLKT